ncbi:MAG: Rieske (2Fe-2S) protein [Planctomycetes bacterium]|nr:Rieske (2Fe-2S) protein [Planctomycetota bacterium]
MSAWIDVGAPAELEFRPGATVVAAGRRIALFRVGDGYRALDNPCPHAGAALADGTLLDGKVACFLHCWEFDLETGACDVGPEWNVRVYPVRERDGRLEIEVEPEVAPD